MTGNRPLTRKKNGFQQVLLQDSSVFSIQWMVLPHEYCDTVTPWYLLERYLHYIRHFTLSLIRPFRTDNRVEFRLMNTPISLISFTGPSVSPDSLTLSISGGVLVQPDSCHSGELSLSARQTRRGVKIILQLSDFCPLLLGKRPSRIRKLLYRITQAYLNRIVTVKFLARTYRELAGSPADIRIVKARIRAGEET